MKPAVLASVPLCFRHLAVPCPDAGVDPLVLYGPLEEPFTALTGDDPVVKARGLVAADAAQHEGFIFIRIAAVAVSLAVQTRRAPPGGFADSRLHLHGILQHVVVGPHGDVGWKWKSGVAGSCRGTGREW